MANQKSIRHLTQYKGPEESPGYLLWRVSTRWRSTIEKTLKLFNLTHPQFVVLAALSWLTQDGDKVNQVDVGRMAGLDPNTTSQIIRGLEIKSFVTRVPSSVDERSKNPTITPHGKDILARALPAVEKIDEAYFAVLQTDELKSMKYVFQKLMQ